jgi:V8-like Glu-specific endopeptidase
MRREDLKKEKDGTFTIVNITKYGESFSPKLCESERFWNQPNPAFCSGVAVSSNLVFSAGHCPSSTESQWLPDASNLVIVFGFGMITVRAADGSLVAQPRLKGYTSSEVFGYTEPLQILTGELNGNKDWSLIRLPGVGLGTSALQRTSKVNLGARLRPFKDSVFVVGYPSGLPVKWTGSGILGAVSTPSNTGEPVIYSSNLDTFGGNSGSPMYSYVRENTVFGLLFQGQTDFIVAPTQPGVPPCQLTATVPDANGKTENNFGEDSLDILYVMDKVKAFSPTVYKEISDWSTLLGSTRSELASPEVIADVWEVEESAITRELEEHAQYLNNLNTIREYQFEFVGHDDDARSVASTSFSMMSKRPPKAMPSGKIQQKASALKDPGVRGSLKDTEAIRKHLRPPSSSSFSSRTFSLPLTKASLAQFSENDSFSPKAVQPRPTVNLSVQPKGLDVRPEVVPLVRRPLKTSTVEKVTTFQNKKKKCSSCGPFRGSPFAKREFSIL